MLYDNETYNYKVTATSKQKLQIIVNKCLRCILEIRWPDTISNSDLYQKCKIDEFQQLIKDRKWSWIGHTLQREIDEIEKQALNWNTKGTKDCRKTARNTSILEEAEREFTLFHAIFFEISNNQ